MPSQTGKVAIVTGANSGIGYVTAWELARHGAVVVLGCRSEGRCKEAQKKIEQELKAEADARRVEFRRLDVSSLASVKAIVDEFKKTCDTVDLLINNADIMAVPYAESADGYESQFATNHLGHFALTVQLVNLIKESPSARVMNASSLAHRQASVDLKEIVTPKGKYMEWPVHRAKCTTCSSRSNSTVASNERHLNRHRKRVPPRLHRREPRHPYDGELELVCASAHEARVPAPYRTDLQSAQSGPSGSSPSATPDRPAPLRMAPPVSPTCCSWPQARAPCHGMRAPRWHRCARAAAQSRSRCRSWCP